MEPVLWLQELFLVVNYLIIRVTMIQTKKQQHENKIKYTVFNQRKQIPLSTVKKFEKSFKVSYFYNFMNLGIEEQLYIYYL